MSTTFRRARSGIYIPPTADSYPTAVLADGPLAYYRHGESSGTTMTDSSGHAHTGAYSGTYALGAPGYVGDGNTALGLTVSPGGLGTTAISEGVDLWLRSLRTLTVECWAQRNGNAHDGHTVGTLVARDSTSAAFDQRSWLLDWNDTGTLTWRGFTGSSQAFLVTTPAISNGPHHIACVYDGPSGAAAVYVDGASVASSSPANNVINDKQFLTIGRAISQSSDGLRYFNGVIDEVAVYGAALSAARIAAHYAAAA